VLKRLLKGRKITDGKVCLSDLERKRLETRAAKPACVLSRLLKGRKITDGKVV
jgi:hypothetical protein